MKRFASLTLAAIFLLPLSQDVEARSYRKNRRQKSFKVKKKEFRIGEVKKKKVKAVTVKKRGPLKLQAFERFSQERLQEKTEAQIRTLQQIISSTPKAHRADLYFRLAEHYWENSKYYNFIGHRYDDYRGRPEWPEKARLQQQSFATAKNYQKKAAKVYYMIVNNYPKFKRLCEAYFFLGKNLFEMGNQKAALNVFRPMLKKFRYPACPFIPNAYLSFGEYYFANGQVRHALKSYQQVLTFRNTSIYGFALYKIAWCYYNLVRYRLSLKKFVEVVRHARNSSNYKQGTQRRRLALLRESRRDLVLAYSQVGDARNARNFFMNVGGQKHYLKMMQLLGRLYRQQGKLDRVIIIYNDLMSITPENPRVLFYQLYITQAVNRSKSKEATIREVFKLVKKMQYFRKRVGAKNKIFKEADTEIKPQLKEFAKYRHYEAQKTRRLDFFKQAAEFYRAYLTLYPKDKNAYELRFWYAEILYKLRRFDKAAVQYSICYKQKPKGKYSKDAAYNTILAYNFLLKRARFDLGNMTQKKDSRKKPLPPLAKKFLGACEDFIKYYPKGAQAIDVSYKAALLYYYFNHFNKALPRFYFLVKKYPTHEYAIYSAHFILDTYNLQKRWVKLNKTAWDFYRRPGLGNPKFKKEVRALIAASGIKTCEAIEKQKKYKECGDCFEKIAGEFNTNKRLASHALFNSSLCHYKAKQPDRALRARHMLIEKYPKSRHVKKSILDLADIYAARAEFQKAAEYYEKYYKKYSTKRKPLWDIRIQAALFREAMGDVGTAMSYYRKMIGDKKFRRKKKKVFTSLWLRVARNQKKRGSLSRYARMMKEFDKKRYGPYALRLHARMEYALSRKRLNFRTEAKKIFRRIPRNYESLPNAAKKKYPEAGYAAAHVRFMEAENLFKEYTKIKLRKRMTKKALKKALGKKQKAFKKAFDAYVKVVKYKQGEWGVAAYYRAGDLYLNFSKFLYSAPPPSKKEIKKLTVKLVKGRIKKNIMKNLKRQKVPWRLRRRLVRRYTYKLMRSKRIKALVKRLVDKAQNNTQEQMKLKSQPVEEKAAEFYERCLRLAHALKAYNRWTRKALTKLQEMKPSQYPKQLESFPRPHYAASEFRFNNKLMTGSTAVSSNNTKKTRKTSMLTTNNK